ncbi:MAG: addiction module protein [Chlorobium sp.]
MHFYLLQMQRQNYILLEIDKRRNRMNITELRKMSTSERLQAMEVLWDSLVYENDAVETPEWHEKILQERKEKIASGCATFITLADLKKSRLQ